MTQTLVQPFTAETARTKVQRAEDVWNTCDPDIVARAYTENSDGRNRDEFFGGRCAASPLRSMTGEACE